MPQTQHPLDNWFDKKPRIHRAGIDAILVDDDWEQFLLSHHRWSPEEVVLIRCLFEPTRQQIHAFLSEMIFDDDEPSPATLKAWRQPMSACWKGSILAPS